MKPGFEAGIEREVTVEVTEEMCPSFDGVLVHRCYSTWSLVHHVELAARRVLVEYLEEHEEGVGVHVSVDHLAPCPVGGTVCVRAKLVQVTADLKPRVICEVTAHYGERLLARGRQVQVVMGKEALKAYIERS